MPKIKKQWVSWEEFEQIQGGGWTPSAHTHVKTDITDIPWAWGDVSKAGSSLTDLATWEHASEHEVGGGDLLAFVDITGFGTYLDQAVKQASSPTFVTAKLTALTNGRVPYHVSDAAGLANSPIFIDGVNVGIGRSPDLDLDVAGSSGAASLVAENGITRIGIDGSIGLEVGADGDNAPWPMWIQSKHPGIDVAYPLILQPVGGDVGIGKAPTEKLDVDGIVKADNFYLAAGVTPNLGWLSDVELGSLEEGETIRYHQATMKFIDAWGIDYDNPRLVYKIYTEFFQIDVDLNDPWAGAAIGTGTRSSIDGTTNHPGIIRFISAAALATGYQFSTNNNCFIIGGAEHSEFIFKTPADMTNIVVRMGFCDVPASGACTDGVYLELIGDELDGRTRNNSAGGSTATHFHVAANTWYRGKLAVNSDATLVTFALYTCTDGIIRWTSTLAANIPTARVTGHGVSGFVAPNDPKTIIDIDMMIATRAGYIIR